MLGQFPKASQELLDRQKLNALPVVGRAGFFDQFGHTSPPMGHITKVDDPLESGTKALEDVLHLVVCGRRGEYRLLRSEHLSWFILKRHMLLTGPDTW